MLLALKLFLTAVVVSLSIVTVYAEKRVALIISNQDYPDTIGKLKLTHKDGNDIENALVSRGFSRENIVRIQDANQDEMKKSLDDFYDKLYLEGNDPENEKITAFFYFSGHGAARSEFGENYLFPARENINSSRSMVRLGVKLGDIIKEIENTQASNSFIVIDACRNVAFRKRTKGGGPKGLFPQIEVPGMLIAFATGPGDTAEDSNAYASILADEITNSDQQALLMFREVRRRVLEKTEQQQTPWVRDGRIESFYFGNAPTKALTVDEILQLRVLMKVLGWEVEQETPTLDSGLKTALGNFYSKYEIATSRRFDRSTLNLVKVAVLAAGQKLKFDSLKQVSAPDNAIDLDEFNRLVADLESTDSSIRRGARSNLASIGPDATRLLMSVLKNGLKKPNNYRLRLGAIVALTEMMRENKPRRLEIIEQLSDDDIQILVKESADQDRTVRIWASEFLYDLGDRRIAKFAFDEFGNATLNGKYNLALILQGAAPFIKSNLKEEFSSDIASLIDPDRPKTNKLLERALNLID